MGISELKLLLGLDEWRCGGLSLKQQPCKLQILNESKKQIKSQLETIRVLTRSSVELEAELQKLVKLVHCRKHDGGLQKDSRIEAWTAVFPVGEGESAPSVPIEKQIKNALGRLFPQCSGTTQEGKRCKRGIGGQKVLNCTRND